MNIFGLFFSFFSPGFVIGMMAMAAVYHTAKRRRAARREQARLKAASGATFERIRP